MEVWQLFSECSKEDAKIWMWMEEVFISNRLHRGYLAESDQADEFDKFKIKYASQTVNPNNIVVGQSYFPLNIIAIRGSGNQCSFMQSKTAYKLHGIVTTTVVKPRLSFEKPDGTYVTYPLTSDVDNAMFLFDSESERNKFILNAKTFYLSSWQFRTDIH